MGLTTLNQFRQFCMRYMEFFSFAFNSIVDSITEIVNTKADKTNFKGATADKAGESGLVPAAAKGDTNKYLCSDGTWKSLPQLTFKETNGGLVISYGNNSYTIPVM